MIAALGNLYVGGMRGRKSEARRVIIGDVSRAPVSKSEIGINVVRINIQH